MYERQNCREKEERKENYFSCNSLMVQPPNTCKSQSWCRKKLGAKIPSRSSMWMSGAQVLKPSSFTTGSPPQKVRWKAGQLWLELGNLVSVQYHTQRFNLLYYNSHHGAMCFNFWILTNFLLNSFIHIPSATVCLSSEILAAYPKSGRLERLAERFAPFSW